MTLGCGSTRWRRICGITITSPIVKSTVGTGTDVWVQIQIQTLRMSRTRQPFARPWFSDVLY
ncbi:hypothetical protein CORC01_04150 [Colletotrichum orchidophilum]|uniref:Uncharacterized protein n=1 Tax=Colletotrichum orchidophilum TaxID=1209926 RepID=A0A1G4BGU0_9PEZI|nr:uncharacterized protein CORC01_04150 [Colletotrichum orchidophilum]OHF00611.1 hypothetical protein CORC01_04150 [Colletotrichum orchidophilum]